MTVRSVSAQAPAWRAPVRATHERSSDPAWSLPLIRSLNEHEREWLLSRAQHRTYRRGEVILRQGDDPEALHFLVSGCVKLVVSSPEGNEMILQLLRDGDCFGETAILDGIAANESAIAVSPTRTLRLSRQDVIRTARANPEFADAIIQLLADRLRTASQRLEDAYLYDLDTRMARCLWRFTEDHGRRTDDGVVVDFPLTQSELAAMLGASRVRVNVLLGAYQDAGLLRLGKGSFTVTNVMDLRTRAML